MDLPVLSNINKNNKITHQSQFRQVCHLCQSPDSQRGAPPYRERCEGHDLTPKHESSFHVRLANKKKVGKQTKGKNPKLVSFTVIEGMRDHANDLENELIRLNRAGAGRRRIRQMIEEYRAYAKLVDLDA